MRVVGVVEDLAGAQHELAQAVATAVAHFALLAVPVIQQSV